MNAVARSSAHLRAADPADAESASGAGAARPPEGEPNSTRESSPGSFHGLQPVAPLDAPGAVGSKKVLPCANVQGADKADPERRKLTFEERHYRVLLAHVLRMAARTQAGGVERIATYLSKDISTVCRMYDARHAKGGRIRAEQVAMLPDTARGFFDAFYRDINRQKPGLSPTEHALRLIETLRPLDPTEIDSNDLKAIEDDLAALQVEHLTHPQR